MGKKVKMWNGLKSTYILTFGLEKNGSTALIHNSFQSISGHAAA